MSATSAKKISAIFLLMQPMAINSDVILLALLRSKGCFAFSHCYENGFTFPAKDKQVWLCTLGLTKRCSARCLFRAVATTKLALQQSFQLIFDKLLAERRKMVGEEDSVKVVYLVLQHAGEVTIKPFVVRL